MSLESSYRAQLRRAFESQPLRPVPPLVEADLAHLPPPVQRYVRRSGFLGRPRVQNFRVAFSADMYRKPGGAPMRSSSIQHNFTGEPTRLFFMRSRMFGLPVQVLHAYAEGKDTFQVRVARLFTMVDQAGEVLSRGETVTLLNDLAVFAPGELVDPRLAWVAVDDRTARVVFTTGPHQVGATLIFDERDELSDFWSDDRPAFMDGQYLHQRWSTPLTDYRDFGGVRLARRGRAVYAAPGGDFTYGTFVLQAVAYDVSPGGD
jgi:hypothetical protein